MKLWITGGEGMLGSCLAALCKKRGIACTPTGRAHVDIADEAAVLNHAQQGGYTHIINCAAYTAVDRAEQEKEKAFLINGKGPENLAKVAKTYGLKLIHVSTNFIFDGTKDCPYEEEDGANPENMYGASKWEGEKRILAVFPEACIIRTSWVFGKGGKNFISSVLERMKTEKTISAPSNLVGRPTSVNDLAEALFHFLDKQGIFHFANHGAVSPYDIACSIQQVAREKKLALACTEIVAVTHNATSIKRPENGVLSTKKVETWLPIRNWQEGWEEIFCEL